jgi:uncharacterized membrane protein YozB (DUF420 family)
MHPYALFSTLMMQFCVIVLLLFVIHHIRKHPKDMESYRKGLIWMLILEVYLFLAAIGVALGIFHIAEHWGHW